jgi:hypothetical protein
VLIEGRKCPVDTGAACLDDEVCARHEKHWRRHDLRFPATLERCRDRHS